MKEKKFNEEGLREKANNAYRRFAETPESDSNCAILRKESLRLEALADVAADANSGIPCQVAITGRIRIINASFS